jgi:hypothetical protein
VTAVFAAEDKDHARAMDFSRSRKPEKIVTTDEVPTEYLAFFSGAKPSVRLQAADNVDALLRSTAGRRLAFVVLGNQRWQSR